MQHHSNTLGLQMSRRLGAHLTLPHQVPLFRPTGIHLYSTSTLRQAKPKSICTSDIAFIQRRRTLTTSVRVLHSPSSPSRSSALLDRVKQAEEGREREDTVGQKLQEGGKGTEGAHYKGE